MEAEMPQAGAAAGEAAADAAAGASTGTGSVFEDIKTSLPRLDIFDPSVFDMRMVLGALTLFGLLSYFAYRLYMNKVVAGDDFIADLGISYADFELPDEIEEYYEAKEAAGDDATALRNPLLKRAIADIPIIMRLQKEGPGMQNLYQQAMIGDREWQAYQAAEALIGEEIEQVQAEAEEIEPGWGQQIWRMASELRQALLQRQQQAAFMQAQQAAAARAQAQRAAAGDDSDEADEVADKNSGAAVPPPAID
eukprot:TRINITY_DN6725_c0_g1_i4.p1 TRINITY_DN6725_c0_g1~~TRINITY_DN6725_c0_g1_i4.p1  ORF type:complete len:251 (-),score=93.39 TRINITY_DN6725_c0_g1_i4:153-905(-)